MAEQLKILYADDDPDDLNFFRDVAGSIDPPILLSTHDEGEDLLRELRDSDPDHEIVFLDLNMPGKDGFDILREIRTIRGLEKVPVVILSTTSDAKSVSRCLKYGANFYMQKPTTFSALKKSIEEAIAIDYSTFRPSKKNFLYRNPSNRNVVF